MRPDFDLWVHGTPQPAGSKRHVGGGRIIDSNPKAGRWKDVVAQAAGEARAGAPLMRGPIEVRFTFFRARPKAHFTTRGELRGSAPEWPTTKPDVLKLARGVEDALTGVVYADDALIVRELLEKHYGETECVHIEIRELN
jgi:Holliday junction resolvase RusA-like endonuclease